MGDAGAHGAGSLDPQTPPADPAGAGSPAEGPADAVSGPSDADLTDRVRSGDTSAYAELWHRHGDAGLRAARQITRRFDADDLTQEAFTRILAAIRRGNGPTDAFRPYLYSVIRRVSMDWARQAPGSANLDSLETTADVDGTNEDEVLDHVITRDAYAALRPEWREVLWYTEVEGLSGVEVGEYLGITPNSVAALAYRAREGLRLSWLQQHVSARGAAPECQWAVDRMPASERGSLSRRDRRRLEDHLETCRDCRDRLGAVALVATDLRAALPAALGLGWALFGGAAGGAGAGGSGVGLKVLLVRLVRRRPRATTAAAVWVPLVAVTAVVAFALARGSEAPTVAQPTTGPTGTATSSAAGAGSPSTPPSPTRTSTPPVALPPPTSAPATTATPPPSTATRAQTTSAPAPIPTEGTAPPPTTSRTATSSPAPSSSTTTASLEAPTLTVVLDENRTPVISVSGDPSLVVEVRVDGELVSTLDLVDDGRVTRPLVRLSPGVHTVSVRTVDPVTGAVSPEVSRVLTV